MAVYSTYMHGRYAQTQWPFLNYLLFLINIIIWYNLEIIITEYDRHEIKRAKNPINNIRTKNKKVNVCFQKSYVFVMNKNCQNLSF